MKTPQEIKAEELVEKFAKHARYWDCYNDVPLEENHAVECAKIATQREIDLCSDILQQLAAKDARRCHITARIQSELIEVLECLNNM